ncbi:MAG: hypothetical protein EHM64_12930 [Ignavibacteriae bacterium]|nr:MAG: hypothetical protein EHM64_12930 [Ignavibacteriota bacterium]
MAYDNVISKKIKSKETIVAKNSSKKQNHSELGKAIIEALTDTKNGDITVGEKETIEKDVSDFLD